MFSHPGDLESPQETDQTNKEYTVIDEDLGLALDASRSFVTRKTPFNHEQEANITNEASTVQVTDIEFGLFYCSPKFPGEYVRPHSGDTQENIVVPISPRSSFARKNKVHLSWKARITEPLQESKISQFISEGHLTNRTQRTEERARTEEVDSEINIFQEKDLQKGKHNLRKEKIKKLIESATFNIVVGLFTLFALFSNSVGTLIDSRTVDLVFDIIAIGSFFVFAGEMIMGLYVEDHYKWSLFFWLDLFSTLSISIHIEFLLEDFFPHIVHESAGLAEVSRASRLVTREGNIIRLLQVFQIGRLYKHVRRNQTLTEMNQRKEALQKGFTRQALEAKRSFLYNNESPSPKKRQRSVGTLEKVRSVIMDTFGKVPSGKVEQTLNQLDDEQKVDIITKEAEKTAAMYRKDKRVKSAEEIEALFKDVEEENIKETKVARKLSDYTMKQIVIVVMLILLIVPLFNVSFYFEAHGSQEYQVAFLEIIIDDPTVTEQAKEQAIKSFIDSQVKNTPHLVFLRIGDKVMFSDPGVNIENLKHSQTSIISGMTNSKGEIYSIANNHSDEKIEAILDMIDTVFICAVLTMSAFLLNRDAQRLVLKPLEKIIRRVNKIVTDPANAKEAQKSEDNLGFSTTAHLVENAIVRMSKLLAIGFGETGSAVITQSFMMTGDLNSALSGTKKVAIFGVCDIHDFLAVTEVLQEETLMFVNTIADIVHSMTDKYAGSVSQNMGDAFLLVWKFPEEAVVENEAGELEIVVSQATQNIADCSLIAFMKIYARINRDPTLLQYREDARLKSRIPNYKVNMRFGLHVGWAIEGAIGSEHKIDSYYLSPDINITWRLEKGTKYYDVPICFSGELYEMLSDKMKEQCRLIDEVNIEELDHPFQIYTVDMSIIGLGKAKDRTHIPMKEKRARQKKKKEYVREVVQTGYSYTLLHTDKYLRRLLRSRLPEFQDGFKNGFKAYSQGDWKTAKEKLEECLMMKHDGPTNKLLRYMEQYGFDAPDGWERRNVSLKK